ncbi:MAG: hypothetical protein ACRDDX_01620 [Cellulosilyticaceae bacterium]
MDKLILGLLILKNFTIYDLQKTIGTIFNDLCSNSTGSIQAAIKKLLQHEMIGFTQYEENSRLKKEYFITPKGIENFGTWVNEPMDTSITNQLQFGKIHFMGLAKKENRLSLVENYIGQLEEELGFLLALEQSIDIEQNIASAKAQIEAYPEKIFAIQALSGQDDFDASMRDVAMFTMVSLDHGISQTKHELEWFKGLKHKLETGAL